jgi:hypothetical protein
MLFSADKTSMKNFQWKASSPQEETSVSWKKKSFFFRVLGAFWRSIRRIKQTLVFENYDL